MIERLPYRETVPIVARQPRELTSPSDANQAGANAGTDGGAADGVRPSNSGDMAREVVIGVLAGRPSDGPEGGGPRRPAPPPWDSVASTAAEALEEARTSATFSKAARSHRRGVFTAAAQGISHGGGQLQPANLKYKPAITNILLYLVGLQAMIRIANFASGKYNVNYPHGPLLTQHAAVFATWAPAIHTYYGATLLELLASDPTLQRNFAGSVWACITFNFGPRTVTFPHRDYANLPFGWCAITALGNFDPNKGGHLILWECKMIIRFPPGSTILIPSAILTHANTKIGRREQRYSVTQYTAGALFRWVEHGFQLDEKYYASLSPEEVAADRQTAAGRWRRGRAMFSSLDDLVAKAEGTLSG